jgi:hypothetical protein
MVTSSGGSSETNGISSPSGCRVASRASGGTPADAKIWAPRTGIPRRCLVSSNVQGYFEELIDDAQDAILSMLGQRTLLEVLTELEVRENAKRQVRNPNRR